MIIKSNPGVIKYTQHVSIEIRKLVHLHPTIDRELRIDVYVGDIEYEDS